MRRSIPSRRAWRALSRRIGELHVSWVGALRWSKILVVSSTTANALCKSLLLRAIACMHTMMSLLLLWRHIDVQAVSLGVTCGLGLGAISKKNDASLKSLSIWRASYALPYLERNLSLGLSVISSAAVCIICRKAMNVTCMLWEHEKASFRKVRIN